jgi:membrane associated rhomboid family serine protease
MLLNANKLGLAAALAVAIIWIVCSVLVMLLPQAMIGVTGDMMHADLSSMQWQMHLSGLLIGLVAWSLTAGFAGWLIALIYNKMQ